LTLLADAFKFVMHPNTMCKFNLSQMTNPALVPALLQLGYAM